MLIFVLECRFLLFLSSFAVFVPQLGTCVAQDANPAANITWLKNNKPLVADGKGIYSSPCCVIINANKTAHWSGADIYEYYIHECSYPCHYCNYS